MYDIENENNVTEQIETNEAPVAEENNENNEVKDNEVAQEETSNRLPVEKPSEDDEPYEKVIEDARSTLFAAYSKSRKISNIITGVILVAAIGAMLCITNESAALNVLGWVIAGVALIGLVVYYMINKNKFPNKTREYIKLLTMTLNSNTFKDERFNGVNSDPNEKMSIEDVVGDSVYDGIGSVASRNVVRGCFEKSAFLYGEVALGKVNATKKDGPIFVGKYISLPNSLELRGRIIINFRKAENPVDIPTSIGNLDLLEENDNMFIYGFKDTDVKQVLGTKFLSKIKDLIPQNHLLNTNIVIWAGKTGFYFSYDDATMALPFDKPFSKECNEQSVENVLTAFECNEILGK